MSSRTASDSLGAGLKLLLLSIVLYPVSTGHGPCWRCPIVSLDLSTGCMLFTCAFLEDFVQEAFVVWREVIPTKSGRQVQIARGRL